MPRTAYPDVPPPPPHSEARALALKILETRLIMAPASDYQASAQAVQWAQEAYALAQVYLHTLDGMDPRRRRRAPPEPPPSRSTTDDPFRSTR